MMKKSRQSFGRTGGLGCKLLVAIGAVAMSVSCSVEHNRFFKGDVIGFSDRVETSYETETRGLMMNWKPQSDPCDLLSRSGNKEMEAAISSVPRGANTTAFYAMEMAAMRVRYVRKKVAKNDRNTRYYIFLLTDGLDNASTEVAKHDKRTFFRISPERYRRRVERKLRRAMGWSKKNIFEVYPVLYEGEDLQEAKRINGFNDQQFSEKLKRDMQCFRYSSLGEESAPELISADNFEALTKELRAKLMQSTYTFRIPKSYAGKNIRMEFEDNRGRKVTMNATLTKSMSTYTLKDISFSDGVTIKDRKISLKSVEYNQSDNVNAYFVIEDFRLNGIAYYPAGKKVVQTYEAEPGFWQLNSEYEEVTESAINTYFILVIDGSKSLDGKNNKQNGFAEEIEMANTIKDILSPSGRR